MCMSAASHKTRKLIRASDNKQITEVEAGSVCSAWRWYRDAKQRKTMQYSASIFIDKPNQRMPQNDVIERFIEQVPENPWRKTDAQCVFNDHIIR